MGYECWAWVEREADGREGVIAAFVPVVAGEMPTVEAVGDYHGVAVMAPVPLMSRDKSIAVDVMAPVAWKHHRRTGNEVRLVHLIEAEGS